MVDLEDDFERRIFRRFKGARLLELLELDEEEDDDELSERGPLARSPPVRVLRLLFRPALRLSRTIFAVASRFFRLLADGVGFVSSSPPGGGGAMTFAGVGMASLDDAIIGGTDGLKV